MTAQQRLWRRALSTRPSGRNECLGRNLPNFPGLDKAHCVLAVTHLAVSSSVSASSTLGISCPYSDFISCHSLSDKDDTLSGSKYWPFDPGSGIQTRSLTSDVRWSMNGMKRFSRQYSGGVEAGVLTAS